MGILDMFKNIFTGKKQGNIITVYLKDEKCGKKMKILLRKSYDIQRVYDEDKEATFMVKKVIICDQCFHRINLELKFDQNYKIISQSIEGGEFISQEEFTA